jgi:hypothetical protein
MRLVAIVASVSALAFASGAIAQDRRRDQKDTRQGNIESQNPNWYKEPAPYRPCPVVASVNGRDVCLGCPSECPWPPPLGK